uniref:Uncharacterized protein n=1 Tax=Gibberella zeae (strain ATCC MYA-4620 / CBS 123657 / FGSC 9075 / NRRL 31084 / PH-1) TaxID=229533 RepID=A0A098DGA9_GIBZE
MFVGWLVDRCREQAKQAASLPTIRISTSMAEYLRGELQRMRHFGKGHLGQDGEYYENDILVNLPCLCEGPDFLSSGRTAGLKLVCGYQALNVEVLNSFNEKGRICFAKDLGDIMLRLNNARSHEDTSLEMGHMNLAAMIINMDGTEDGTGVVSQDVAPVSKMHQVYGASTRTERNKKGSLDKLLSTPKQWQKQF